MEGKLFMGTGQMTDCIEDNKLIDLLKFLCAYLVIGIHTRPFQVISILLDKFFYYNISNYAVPFFYACTGYFLIIKQPEDDLHMKLICRVKKVLKIYLIWSTIYFPLTIYGWIIEGNLSLRYALRCLKNYFLVGENFYSWTLWYLNGLIFALILIDILNRKLSIKQITIFGVGIYLFGIFLTIMGGHRDVLPKILEIPVKSYFAIFETTRNGLFQSLVYVSIGMYIAKKQYQKEVRSILHTGIAVTVYIIKIPLSLIGGGNISAKYSICRFSISCSC